MNSWQLMILKDDFICTTIDALYSFYRKFYFKEVKLLRQMKNQNLQGLAKDVYIVLNSPSLQNQDLSVLKGKSLMFVNRGFYHPLYKELQPRFHTFVDPKMLTGEWPVTWLDDILALSPNITFIMPVSWAFNKKFIPYIQKGVSFYWLPPNGICNCLGVAGECFQFAINQQFSNIYFTGFEASGIAYELIKANSHFYGVNEENLQKTTKDYVIDLLMHCRHLNDLNRFAKKCKNKGISIINLTDGGLLDMFPRKKITDII